MCESIFKDALKRYLTLAGISALLERIKHQSLSNGGHNWCTEICSCMHYTVARETAGSLDTMPHMTGNFPKMET
jgi:hypothetical protein